MNIIKKLWWAIIMVCCTFSGVYVLSYIVTKIILFIKNPDVVTDEEIFKAVALIPLCVYFYWAWVQPWSINKIKNLIY